MILSVLLNSMVVSILCVCVFVRLSAGGQGAPGGERLWADLQDHPEGGDQVRGEDAVMWATRWKCDGKKKIRFLSFLNRNKEWKTSKASLLNTWSLWFKHNSRYSWKSLALDTNAVRMRYYFFNSNHWCCKWMDVLKGYLSANVVCYLIFKSFCFFLAN